MINGIALINKPPGITSTKLVSTVGKKLPRRTKVGHCGTLDSFAEGLMILLFGPATRLNRLFSGLDKRYNARSRWGESTATLDPLGEVTERAPLVDERTVRGVLDSFIGAIEQIPPIYSAIHIGGKRAHRLARAGVDVAMPSRAIDIKELKLTAWQPPYGDFFIHCSKGTYVRALLRDIAASAGSCCYCAALTRLMIGPFSVADAVSPDAFSVENISPVETAISRLAGVTSVKLDSHQCIQVANGVPLSRLTRPLSLSEGISALMDDRQRLLAVAEKIDDRPARYLMVMPEAVINGKTDENFALD